MENVTIAPEDCLKIEAEQFDMDPNVPYLDQEQLELLTMAAGDAGFEFFDDLISTFQKECSPRIEALQKECNEKNLSEIRRNVHFIAGSSANIGLGRLSKLCRNIEKQCDNNAFVGFESCTVVVQNEIRIAIEKIREHLKSSV